MVLDANDFFYKYLASFDCNMQWLISFLHSILYYHHNYYLSLNYIHNYLDLYIFEETQPFLMYFQWLVLGYPTLAPYLDTARECYEAYVIYNFMMFLLNFLDDEMDLDATMESKPQTSHFFPLCCLKPWRMGRWDQHYCFYSLLCINFPLSIFNLNTATVFLVDKKKKKVT